MSLMCCTVDAPQGECAYLLLDFLPLLPTDPATAAALLLGGSVPGEACAYS